MFMPETIPTLPPETLRSWAPLSYSKLVYEVCSLFIPEELIPRRDLEGESWRLCVRLTKWPHCLVSSVFAHGCQLSMLT